MAMSSKDMQSFTMEFLGIALVSLLIIFAAAVITSIALWWLFFWKSSSSTTKSLQDSRWVCTSFPHVSQFRQQLIKAFTNGKVSTLSTVEYFLIAFLAQRKEFIFQSKNFSIDDRNLFFGISNFCAFQVLTNLEYQQIFAWCTRTSPSLPICNISFKQPEVNK